MTTTVSTIVAQNQYIKQLELNTTFETPPKFQLLDFYGKTI